MNNAFSSLDEDDLMNTSGGVEPISLTIVLGVATVLGGYAAVREMVKDAARAKAWDDLKTQGYI